MCGVPVPFILFVLTHNSIWNMPVCSSELTSQYKFNILQLRQLQKLLAQKENVRRPKVVDTQGERTRAAINKTSIKILLPVAYLEFGSRRGQRYF